MNIKDNKLPTDPAELQHIIHSLFSDLEKNKKELARSHQEIEKLRFQLNKQLAKQYGSSSEALTADQLNLFDEPNDDSMNETEIAAADEELTVPEHQRRKKGRKP